MGEDSSTTLLRPLVLRPSAGLGVGLGDDEVFFVVEAFGFFFGGGVTSSSSSFFSLGAAVGLFFDLLAFLSAALFVAHSDWIGDW